MSASLIEQRNLALMERVRHIVMTEPVDDIHTHLYDPAFGSLLLWGIDDLLVYHYLVAETFRQIRLPYDDFWKLSKARQAEVVWDALFVQHSPLSEACRGVLTTLNLLGLDVKRRDLETLRKSFREWQASGFVDRCLDLANVRSVCMTNSPFDREERAVWEGGLTRDERFVAALRIDPILVDWPNAVRDLRAWGYAVQEDFSGTTVAEAQRFLRDWTDRIKPKFVMVSLPPTFTFPDSSPCSVVIEKVLMPHCREFNLPFALMPGVKRGVNPQLRMAGDGSAVTRLDSLERLCAAFPENKFLATVLARENQHELCVIARKFRNLHIFGCWWFLNTPSLIEEITRMRLELLGPTFTAQHSDARVLDQLIYKWQHSRRVFAKVLAEKYVDLAAAGWEVSDEGIRKDVRELFGGTFQTFCAG